MIGYGTLLRLHTRFDKPLAGVVNLSGIVPCHPDENGQISEELPQLSDQQIKLIKETPKLMYIGDQDRFFPMSVANLTYELIV